MEEEIVPIGGEDFFFLVLLIVTISHLKYSKGLVEGDKGVLSEKIERVFKREGSEKAGAEQGLTGG